MTYQYSQEAKDRISNLGQSAVTEFLEEIPLASRRRVYSSMPKVPGFRPGHPAEFKEKQKRLVGYMLQTHTPPEAAYAWKSFSFLWNMWAEEYIGKPLPLEGESELAKTTGADFIITLAEYFPKLAREYVERLYTFSGFPDESKISEAFGLFRTATVLARDNMVDSLQIRFEDAEERIKVIEIAAQDSNNDIKNFKSTVDLFSEELKEISRNIDCSLKLITNFQNLLNSQEERSNVLMESLEELHVSRKKFNDLLKELELRVDSNSIYINQYSLKDQQLNFLSQKLSELQTDFHDFCAKETESSEPIERGCYDELSERLSHIESCFTKKELNEKIGQSYRFNENKRMESYVDIYSYDDAFNLIASNLQAVGLVKGTSLTVARLTLAAFISGQIVQFCGSLADIVADSVAVAVGAPIYHEWRVPVGLVSDDAAVDFIDSAAESSCCLVLKGANLSAFEIYGSAIRDIIVQRQFHTTNYDHLALIATCKQGHAVFPDGGMLAELGPIIDTDSLKMRGISANLPKLNFGHLTTDKWAEIGGLKSDDFSVNMDELRELLKETGFDGGGLWRRMVHKFYSSLMRMPGGNYIYDLHSVLFFYTLPWAKVKDGPVKEISDIAERELKTLRDKMSV